MNGEDLEPRDRILTAAIALIGQEADPERITVRQIAGKANVGIGLINYHFGSKEALLNEAVGALMQREVEAVYQVPPGAGESPAERVRAILKQTIRVGMQFPKLAQMLARQALLSGDYGAERALLPALREHYAGQRGEPEIRLTAIQIVAPLQVMMIRAADVEMFAEVDLWDQDAADRIVDLLVENILQQ